MEQNKLEEQIKHRLSQRAIQPGAEAWDRLDAMLSVNEEKKKPNRSWIYMAACFLALLLAGTFFLNRETDTIDVIKSNPVVTKPVQSGPAVNSNTTDIIKQMPVTADNDLPVAQVNARPQQNKAVKVNSLNVKPEKHAMPYKEANVANVTNNSTVKPAGLPKINVDADALLASVEAEPTVNHISQNTVQVDAGSLLTSVEGELNESFRSKAIQSIVKNYKVIKTSVANRNYQ